MEVVCEVKEQMEAEEEVIVIVEEEEELFWSQLGSTQSLRNRTV